MISYIAHYAKMPPPATTLGIMFGLLAVVYLLKLAHAGYLSGNNSLFSVIKNGTTSLVRNILYVQGILFSNGFAKPISTNNLSKSAVLTAALVVLLACASVLFIIAFLDKPVSYLAVTYYNRNLYTIVDFICSLAEGWFVFGVLLLLALIGIIFKRHRLLFTTNVALIATIYAAIIDGIIKVLFSRERPIVAFANWHFFCLLTHFTQLKLTQLFYAYNSMPSGHTMLVAAAIMPFFIRCRLHKAYYTNCAKALLVLMVLLVAYSRIYTLNHWLSDVYLSMLIGSFIGWAACITINPKTVQVM